MNIKDSLHFISTLSVAKLLNAMQLYFSFLRSKKSGNTLIPALPITLSIEPTTQCNLGCPECPSGLKNFTRPTGQMELELFKKIADETSSHLLYMYFYFQGEPYLNPLFLEMVRYASSKKIYSVTSTNAHFLTERKAEETVKSGLSRILISLDGTTQQVYEQYRKQGSLEKVLEGTKRLVEAKRKLKSNTPHIVFQFLVVRHNEHQIDDAKRLAKEIGVDDILFKTAQIYDFEHGSDLIPSQQNYSRYKVNALGKWEIKNKLDNQCWKLWHSAVITWDGKVVPCCFDKDAKYAMGTISRNALAEIWNSDSYFAFRKKLLVSRKEIDICKNCSEGTRVWA